MAGWSVGVVSTAGVDARELRRPNADSYVVASDGRLAWLDENVERTVVALGCGTLVALVTGDDELAHRSANAAAQALAKLWQPGRPRDAAEVVARFVLEAHTRMYWIGKEHRPRKPSASLGLVWAIDGQVTWVGVGATRLWVSGGGRWRHLGTPWVAGESQRFMAGSRGLGDDTALHLRRDVNWGTLELAEGERLVIASPGAWGAVDEASLRQVVEVTSGVQQTAVACMERARARGGREAVSFLVLERQG